MGPLLFLVYINDLPLNIHRVKLVLSADDTNILVADKNEDALQQKKILHAMKELELWFKKNDLIINIEKTLAMFFHSSQFRLPNKPLTVFSNTLTAYKPEVMVLGIYITEYLKWDVHIRSLE